MPEEIKKITRVSNETSSEKPVVLEDVQDDNSTKGTNLVSNDEVQTHFKVGMTAAPRLATPVIYILRGGPHKSEARAAIITNVVDAEKMIVDLAVFTRVGDGMLYHPTPHPVDFVPYDEAGKTRHSWHF